MFQESKKLQPCSDVISIIGLGYIGLPTAAMFASSGATVVGVDISERAVDAVNAGLAHFEEEGLSEMVSACVAEGTLSASLLPTPADNFIIAVPTPVDHKTHVPDISYVLAAGRSIAPVLKKGDLIVLESTSPVGTTQLLASLLSELRQDLSFPLNGEQSPDVNMAYCPERIIPGRMLHELVQNDRIIGGMTSSCSVRAAALYSKFVKGDCIPSSDRTAELCKLTENAFRDVNIAFANELSMICSDLGIDAWEVIELANHHPRVNILNPGPGVGGHCIAVDPWFIVAGAPDRAKLITAARHVNDAKPLHVLQQVAALAQVVGQPRIACLGLTYKPDVDDFRESPALQIAQALSERYPGQVMCVDPYQEMLLGAAAEGIQLSFDDPEIIVSKADIVLMLVGHSEFRKIPRPENRHVVDTIGFWR